MRAQIGVVMSSLIVGVRLAEACTCVQPRAACEDYWKVSAVFLGTVTSVARSTGKGPAAFPPTRRVTFTVQDAFKGLSSPEVVVRTGAGGGDCGYDFKQGRQYLVYAYRNEPAGELTTGICSRTKPVERAQEDLAYARAIASGATAGGRISGTISLGERSLVPQRTTPFKPMPNLTVTLENETTRVQAITDSRGAFAVSDLLAGTYRVSLDLSQQYYAEIVPTIVELLDDRGCAEMSATIFYDGHVTGRLVTARGDPVAGATVELTVLAGIDEPYGPERLRTMTKGDGTYTFVHVPPGRFIVGVNTQRDRNGELPEPRAFHPGAETVSDASAVVVGRGAKVALEDFVLPARLDYVPITGIVLTTDGSPVAGARVYLKGPSEIDYILSEPAVSDSSGRFLIAALSGRHYRLFAERASADSRAPRLESSEQKAITAAAGLPPVTLTLRRRY